MADGNRLGPCPRVRDDAPPEELIAEERYHDARKPGAQAGGRGPRPAVMTDGPAAREQPIVRSIADHEDVRGKGAPAEMGPSFGHDPARPRSLQRGEDGAREADGVLGDPRAEPDVDRRLTGRQEVEQGRRRLI